MTDHEGADEAEQGTEEKPAGEGDIGETDGHAENTVAEDTESDATDAESGDSGHGDGEEGSPVGDRDRLEALQQDIDEVRQRVADPTDQGEERFIQEGGADDDEPVDDTIAPPG